MDQSVGWILFKEQNFNTNSLENVFFFRVKHLKYSTYLLNIYII